jgi:large subunit ribosomal protein L2
MAIKKFKPTTPGRRQMTWYTFAEVTKTKPTRSLTIKLKSHAWRNNTWTITVRHQGGWHAKRYRLIDFFFTDKKDIVAKVESIGYDPYRTGYIALICYKDWERRYVLAHKDMKVWDKIVTATEAPLVSWNRMEVWNIPVWLQVYNLELIVWHWASSIRSAGSVWIVYSQEWEYTQIKMPSSEIRLVHKKCFASLGQVSNTDHNMIVIGKAWRSRWLWRRPTVLWKSMNPVDHPHGWWEGHTPIWLKAPKTPWGKKALWMKTRSRKKTTSKWILKDKKWRLVK